MTSERFNVLSRIMIGFEGTVVPDYIAGLAEQGLRSVALYGENIDNPQQLRELVSSLRDTLGPDAIISLDEEGGSVTRVDYRTGSRFAGNGFLGKVDDLSLTERDGQLIGQMLGELGINLNLAPVADTNSEPLNPVIGMRSFGPNQDRVADHVASFVAGHERTGVGSTLKHFPGHGNVTIDSHATMPEVPGGLEELRRSQFEPFKKGINAGASAVMLAHLEVGVGEPTSLSSVIVDILRKELHFDGLIVTDALDMGALGPRSMIAQNAIKALLAGVDLICMGPRTRVDELDQIMNIWASVESRVATKNQIAASKRLESFIDKIDPPRSESIENLEYPELTAEIPIEGKAQVIRISSSANPAIGEAPWYSTVHAAFEVRDAMDVAGLVEKFDGVTVVLAQTVGDLKALDKELNPDLRERILVISSELPPPDFSLRIVCTFGASRPQSRLLVKQLLQKGIKVE